jgi:hypothetical protein
LGLSPFSDDLPHPHRRGVFNFFIDATGLTQSIIAGVKGLGWSPLALLIAFPAIATWLPGRM